MPEVGRRRRTPSVPIFYPDWLLLHELSRDVGAMLETYARGTLLDIGCGAKPYAEAGPRVERWIGVDLADNPEADINGTAYAIPVSDAYADCVLCTQVLEHLEDPRAALVEFGRVLKPNGLLILSVPQYWPLHEEPRDFFRYTEIGLTTVMRSCGFDIVEHRRQGVGIAVAGQALNNAILCAGDTFSFKESLAFKASKAPFYLAVNLATALLNPLLKTSRDVLNHTVVARR